MLINSNLERRDIPYPLPAAGSVQFLVIILPDSQAAVWWETRGLTHDLRCWVPVLIAREPLPAWCPGASGFSICSSTTLPSSPPPSPQLCHTDHPLDLASGVTPGNIPSAPAPRSLRCHKLTLDLSRLSFLSPSWKDSKAGTVSHHWNPVTAYSHTPPCLLPRQTRT